MNQLDNDIKYFEFCKKYSQSIDTKNFDTNGMLGRLLGYMKELKLFRMREMMNVKTELNSVELQMQSSKAELERWQRWQIVRQVQDPSQITQQGEVE